MTKTILTMFLLLFTTGIQAQMFWQRPVVNYNRHTYNAANQNWMVAQHQNGWMYFANNKGLLEFDGIYWNLYPLPHATKMRSIKIGKDNRIYVGGLKEFGFFTDNNQGGLQYHSLSKTLAPSKISNIWNIHILNNKVYYQGDRYIYCYDQGKLTSFDCNGVSYSNVINNKIYFSNVFGLSYISGKQIIHVPHSDFLSNNTVTSILPYQNKLMIVTSEQGIFLYDGQNFHKSFPAIDASLRNHRVSCASLYHNTLALGTTDAGLFLVDLKSQHVEIINTNNGLQNKSILSMKFDLAQNLWLGLDNGIDYVSLNSNLFFLNNKLVSIGAGYCSQNYNGKLYLGTNQGIQQSDIPTTLTPKSHLYQVTEMTGQTHCMYQHDGKLFCGGRNFFAMIDDSQIQKFPKRGVWHVQAIGQDGNAMLIGTYWGLEVMRKQNGKWNITNKITGLKTSAKTLYIEPESGNVWIANKSDGIWRITLDTKFTKVLHKKNYNTQQLPKGDNVYITKIGNDIIFASRQGIFLYDDNKDALIPASRLEKRLDGHCPYTYVKQEQDGKIWYVANGILKCLDSKRGLKHSYWKDYMIEDFEDVYSLNNHQTIVGTEDGFVLIDLSKPQAPSQKLVPQVRKLFTTNNRDSLIYGKSIAGTPSNIRIAYRYNSIRIEYGCNNYNLTQAISYSYRLKGYNNQWSEYTTATCKEYTNLPEGTYTFELKLSPDSGNKAIQTSFTFTILPPWYRSWWAYTSYIILIILGIYYCYHRYQVSRERLIRLKDAEMTRQKTVLERDINEKKKQIDKLEEEKLRNELNYKLGTLYPQLTNKDKMLCAYIKMDLMSKEIAPLLNISVRGVEISRYRLRKKLDLDEKANLAEFLQKLD